jgi:hypothetical protein
MAFCYHNGEVVDAKDLKLDEELERIPDCASVDKTLWTISSRNLNRVLSSIGLCLETPSSGTLSRLRAITEHIGLCSTRLKINNRSEDQIKYNLSILSSDISSNIEIRREISLALLIGLVFLLLETVRDVIVG